MTGFKKCISLAAALLALGCSSTAQEKPASTPAAVPLAPQQVVEPPQQVVEPPQQVVEPPQQVVEPPQQAVEPKEQAQKPALAKPKSKISGCLASPEGRDPGTEPTARSTKGGGGLAPLSGLTVTAQKNGLVAVHEFRHPCCLTVDVDTKVQGKEVRIDEVLSGTSCKCLCVSTIETTVPVVKEGAYAVTVELSRGGNVQDTLTKTAEYGK